MALAIGFIGLGTMGKPMATNLLRAGFDLTVYDVRPEPVAELAALGAKAASSSRELGEHAEIIELAVPDDKAVEAAVLAEDGALEGARPDSIIAIHSTVHPQTVKRVAERAGEKGVHVLDVQMSGGQEGASGRTLCFMAGGDREILERCRPALSALGAHIFHVGPLGSGAVAKAAQQIITVVNLLAASEGFRLAEKAGVDLGTFSQLLAVSAGQSYITDRWLERFQSYQSTDPRPFYRGLRPIISLAFDMDIQVPGAALAQQTVPWALLGE